MIRIFMIFLLSFTLYASDIKIGYSIESMSEINKKDLKISMVLWVKEIVSHTKYRASYIDYDNSKSMAKDFNAEKLDLVIDFGVNFIKNYEMDKLEDGFRGGMKNGLVENIIVILKKNSSLEDFAKIKKPIIALQNIEEIFKIYAKVNLIPKAKKYTFLETKKRTGALLKLFFDRADAAIVAEKTYRLAKELNPQIGKKLKIVDVSHVKSGAFGYFHKNFDGTKREAMIEVALALDKSVRGKQLLALFQIDKVERSKVTELKSIEKLYKEYLKLNKGRK
jgi:hypothetical protein